MFSPRTKRNIQRIIPFGLIWLFLGWIFLFIEMAAMGGWENTPSPAIKMDVSVFVFASLAVSLVGMVIGIIELAYLNKLFSKYSFWKKLLFKFLVYSLLLSAVIFITFMSASAIENRTSVFNHLILDNYLEFIVSLTHLSTALQMTVSLIVSLFYREINDTIGNGFLLKFFTGKYHQPVEEQRIFMFLDMKSSTTHAEQLGNEMYFRMLKDYYDDLSDAVVKYGGEIYQYVGDEIIVSWRLKKPADNNQAILCFFGMQSDLRRRHTWYMENYGVEPTFKAGMHFGKVIAGEIGRVKKDILFTGDVLNATARIQALCNHYGVDLLVSADLVGMLDPGQGFRVTSVGVSQLRGKREKIELCHIEKVE